MTRLMCSNDRKEVESLKSKLFRAGIRSEISSNPLTNALGILRLELNIYESDFIEASRIHQEFVAARDSDGAPHSSERSSARGRAGRKEVEVLVEPEPPASASAQLAAPGSPEADPAGGPDGSGGELAQAAVLLEKEVEEVLARDQQLAEQCAGLRDQVKALNQSLAQVQAELARESSARLGAERQLTEASGARASLAKELEGANLRLSSAEQSLTEAQGRLESQTHALKLQQTKVGDLKKEVASRDSQLGALAESLAQTRAALDNEKGLRQIAEQKAGEHAAVRKSLEQQVARLTELQTQLQAQNQHEREQLQSYLDTVNKLLGRLSQKRASSQEG